MVGFIWLVIAILVALDVRAPGKFRKPPSLASIQAAELQERIRRALDR